jgi:P pilus assembly chaperone PapD
MHLRKESTFREMHVQRLLLGLTLLFGIYPRPVLGQISVNTVVMTMSPDKPPVRNIVVTNNGDEVLGVTVRTRKVVNPGTGDERQEETSEVLVAPQRFSLPGKGERVVRLLVRTKAEDNENTYRLSFVPETREDENTESQPTSSPKTALKILTGVGVLVFVEPPTIFSKLLWKRLGDKVSLQNKGNVNILVDEISICYEENRCREASGKRLYPGQEYTLQVSPTERLSIRKRVSESSSVAVLNKTQEASGEL